MLQLGNVWDFPMMWDVFAFILKIVAAFVMIIFAILGVGMLLKILINAIAGALRGS